MYSFEMPVFFGTFDFISRIGSHNGVSSIYLDLSNRFELFKEVSVAQGCLLRAGFYDNYLKVPLK